MPTYEYYCEKCNHTFELFQSMKDEPIKVCPKDKCARERWGKGKVKRQIGGGAGLIFKGSGFYITDYRSDSYKASATKDSEHSTKKNTSANTPSNSTPAASPATPSSSKSGTSASSNGSKAQ